MTKRLVAIGNRSGVTAAIAELAEAHEMKMAAAAAERLAVAVRASFIAAFIAGPLADLEQQNQHGREMAQQADLDAMYAQAAGRWGY